MTINLKKILTLILIGVFFSFAFNSCFFVKKSTETSSIELDDYNSKKPKVRMSEQIVRSVRGDFISFIPENWFFVDMENKLSPDIIAVATNPDYTLIGVFSQIRNTETITQNVKREGLYGLARAGMGKKNRKTGGTVKQIGKFETLQMGSHNFVKYSFSSTEGAIAAQSVVFISQLNEFYEFSLIPVATYGKVMPTTKEIDDIFESIVSTIKY